MELKPPHGAQGSMGIPPHMMQNFEKQRQERAEKSDTPTPAPAHKDPVQQEAPPVEPNAEVAEEFEPTTILQRIGVTFTDDDLQRLIMKGFFETKVDVIPGKLTATLRTLLGDEYDKVDELLAEDAKNKAMTNDGFQTRRAMWILSFGVIKLNEKPLFAKEVDSKGKKKTPIDIAKARREVLGALAPAVTNLLIRKHGALSVAINAIVEKPEQLIKNS